jgi:hypothetical protein
MTNQEDVAQQISALNKERINIQIQKKDTVRSQKYEEAAKIRDQEKKVESEILMLLSAKFGIDFVTEISLKRDILKLLDLTSGDEIAVIESIINSKRSDLRREVVERLLLINTIERYKLGQVSISEVNEAIKESFDNLKKEFKQKIVKVFEAE